LGKQSFAVNLFGVNEPFEDWRALAAGSRFGVTCGVMTAGDDVHDDRALLWRREVLVKWASALRLGPAVLDRRAANNILHLFVIVPVVANGG